MQIMLRGGSVIGRSHLLMGKNSQDSFVTCQAAEDETPQYIGVIADGCGSAPRSEVGALLLTRFLAEALKRHRAESLVERFLESAQELLEFLGELAARWESPQAFTLEHLLATTLGFVSDGQEVLLFVRGDGYVFLGDSILRIDEDDRPNYLAYELWQLEQTPNLGFQLLTVELAQCPRIALSTDGFEPGLIDQFWDKAHPNGVQRQLNALSRKKHFSDDATIITLEALREVDEDECLRQE